MALFGEKYDNDVRVVAVPGFSVELCGGTHCARTGDIGLLKVQAEAGVAAGVRRIEAQTGTGALRLVAEAQTRLAEASTQLKTDPGRLIEVLTKLQDDKRGLERELAELRHESAKAAASDMLDLARDIGGVKVLAAEFDGDLKEQADRLRSQLGTSLVALAARRGPKVQLLVAVTSDIAGSRVHAGTLIREIAPLVGGGGGGRPDMAQAGGKDSDGIPSALERVYSWAVETLG